MVRRRSGKVKAAHSKPRGVDRRDSKLKRWKTAEDVPMDEEDQFHSSRDKILLEGDEAGGDDSEDEEEVFALKGMPGDDSSEEEEDEDQYGDDVDDIDDAHYAAAAAAAKEKKKAKDKKAKAAGKKGKNASSDEDSSEDGSEEEEGWGKKKSAYYASNAELIESDDEEANELEEQEAKRLQTKARDVMADDDFGLGDVEEGAADDMDGIVDEPEQSAVQQLPQDKQSLLRHLEKTNPEALALAQDWEDVAYSLVKSKARIEKLQKEDPTSLSLSMMHLHYQALLTYATTLAFYLHLRASPKFVARPELLSSHPVLGRLLSLKQALHTLEDYDFAASDDGSELSSDFDLDDSDLSLSDEEEEDAYGKEMDWRADAQALWAGDNTLTVRGGKKSKGKFLEQGELESLLSEANALLDHREGASAQTNGKPKRKSKGVEGGEPEPPKKKRKAADKAIAPVFDLVEPELPSSSKPKPKPKQKPSSAQDTPDVYGEASALDATDAADKSARKKSLRFHVARIESTAARRAGARVGALGGDDDIPYKERKREREARLAKEVAKARDAARGDDLDDIDPKLEGEGNKGKKRQREEEEEEDGSAGSGAEEDGYYDLVRRKSKEEKVKKKAEYEAAVAAARHVDDEETGDGPRSLTRAILKNKGLTPSRSKAVRNPRVKKRQKYEQAKKKVSSQRAVYRGGMDATRYTGEKTGISTTVKSVQLS